MWHWFRCLGQKRHAAASDPYYRAVEFKRRWMRSLRGNLTGSLWRHRAAGVAMALDSHGISEVGARAREGCVSSGGAQALDGSDAGLPRRRVRVATAVTGSRQEGSADPCH
ncbi:hypothetical protein NDU88_007562 [Pleurodeles waltl]|uniref:Uncharacterized protein n=1 Tax=Pleurodeles waltl TaxID=8319 RepID=A0AAV7U1L2_PLEWA|nr:hypothetical protein NDU88_007562 [Pleurodeles waltl]